MEHGVRSGNLGIRLALGFLGLIAIMLLLVFVPAGTLRWWQGWLFTAVFLVPFVPMILYFVKHDPHLIASRMSGTEPRRSQELIAAALKLSWVASMILPGLDHRFHWSHVSAGIVILGDALILASVALFFRVFKENTFAAATVRVEAEQRVISTGPYALVRHPMYAGAIAMFIGTPLGLGSVWALLTFPFLLLTLVARLVDEERYLGESLPGYADYLKTVRYRLIPHVW
jgi:protein-S-isoprenylcysteine O-methyltransferase Ste14